MANQTERNKSIFWYRFLGLLYRPGEKWNTRWFGELAHLDSVNDRAELWRIASRRFMRRNWLRFALYFPFAYVVLHLVCPPVGFQIARWFPDVFSPRFWSALAGGMVGGLTLLGFFWIARSAIRRELRRELNNRGFSICLRCGYDLRGQTDPRCPECGTVFVLREITPPAGARPVDS